MYTTSLEAEQADLIRALAVLGEKPGPSHPAVAAALGLPQPSLTEYTELFVHQLPPYASIYLDRQGQIGGEARDRIAGFWRAVGSVPPSEPDHLAALLGLWAALVERGLSQTEPERRTLIEHSSQAMVWEHLASWLTPYLMRVMELVGEPYRSWAGLLTEVVHGAIGEGSDETPSHFIEETRPPDGPQDLVPFLLSPIRSGLVLTRADVARAAGEVGLGLRLGERAYSLRSLIEQSGPEVVGWLVWEARRQAELLRSADGPAPLSRWWSERAAETARLLDSIISTPLA